MAGKQIEMIRELIDRLNDKKFDLEAWKNHAEIYLEQIFGKDSSVIKMIRELKYDYSSWNLRDVSGAGKPANPVIVKAREILEAAAVSLQQFGIPEKQTESSRAWQLLEEELTGKQLKDLHAVIQSEDAGKQEKLATIIGTLDHEVLAKIIAGTLLP